MAIVKSPEYLRQEFLSADMGVSGAKSMVAETGTLVLVTNEGNGRMCTTLPPVHVAVVGSDKMLPDWESLTVVLKLLVRNATGQKLSTYTSFITGPSRAADIELNLTIGVHGPKALYVWAISPDFLLC